ncbi:DUF1766-domain-containing protein [Hyaloscypha variabilis F]|uniref:DUF1766-domain-containing protein n=1 Tax=Hyaloscypha variabilis (strain UAMH 11265 / GT02V1 / F) TaxID=1149755 RepID=A0A2J6RC66_HYAVF|nr:DUF1766-domain-containing protein [Hyaloscypha variabilis F]
MSSIKNTRAEMGSRHSRHSESQNSDSQPGRSSPPTLPSSTSRQTRHSVSKARPGFDDDVRSLGIASPRAGQRVTPPTNPPKGRSSRTELTRSYDYNTPRAFENGVRSSGIAPSAPLTPPTSPPKWSPQTNYPRSERRNVDEVRLLKRASASRFTPPTSPPNSSRKQNAGIPPSPRGLEDGVSSSRIAPSGLRTPPTTPPRNESAFAPKEKPAGNRNHIELSSLKTNLGLNASRCYCPKDDEQPCRVQRSKDTNAQINYQVDSMITLTRSSPEFESQLKKLVDIANCHYHLSPKFKERRIETLTSFFPDGDGDTEPSVEKHIRKAIGQVSTQCIGISMGNECCKERIGGEKVQNCSKTIDEIVKPEVYLDDDYLDYFLKVLEANMCCHLQTHRPLKCVAQWKLRILEIRKRAGSKVMPSIESDAAGRSRSQTRAPDARGTRRYSTTNNNALVSQNRGWPTQRSSRSLTLDLARDPATFWPKTYDTTPFDILLRSNRLADDISPYHLIQSKLKLPLDNDDQQDGYVYLYEVPGNSGFVKLGYTTRSVEVRHQEWEFDCNRVPRALYPIPSSSAIPVRYARRVETLCHAELDHRRIRIYCKGCLKQHIEWFEISPAEAIAVIRKWSKWTATLPYEMPRLRSGAWELKEEERQKTRNIDRFMKELSFF